MVEEGICPEVGWIIQILIWDKAYYEELYTIQQQDHKSGFVS